jgi:hypothetical protein
VLFFHASDDQTVTYQKVDWTIAGDSMLAGTLREALASSGLACPSPLACKR